MIYMSVRGAGSGIFSYLALILAAMVCTMQVAVVGSRMEYHKRLQKENMLCSQHVCPHRR